MVDRHASQLHHAAAVGIVIARIRHRIRQGLVALTAFAHRVDWEAAAEVLTAEQLALFRRMRRSEQLHSLRVMKTLRTQGHDHPDLLTAALLHDVGKSRYPLTLPERTLVVLVRRLAPRLAARWGAGQPRGWRRAFVIARQHPLWSAEDMLAAGTSPLAAMLARRHQERLDNPPQSEEERLLRLLQAADEGD